MDPFTIAALGISVASGIASAIAAGASDEEVRKLREQMLAELSYIDPNVAQEVGLYLQDNAEILEYSTPEDLKDAQRQALAQVQRRAEQGGKTIEDEANLAAANREASEFDRTNRAGIIEDRKALGSFGSGDELAASLAGASASADRMGRTSLNAASEASRRALEAAVQSGSMATQQRGQEFGEAEAKANAVDQMNRFNASQRTNADVANNQVRQNNFANRFAIAQERNRIREGQAGDARSASQQNAAMFQGVGQGVAQGVNAYGQREDFDRWMAEQKKKGEQP
jgi:hypothetical protein